LLVKSEAHSEDFMSHEIVRKLLLFALATCSAAYANVVTIDVNALWAPANFLVTPTAELTGSFVVNQTEVLPGTGGLVGAILSVDLTLSPLHPGEPAEPFYATYTVLLQQGGADTSVWSFTATPAGDPNTLLTLRFATATGAGNEPTLAGYTGGALCTGITPPDPATCEDLNSTVDTIGVEGDSLTSGNASLAPATGSIPEPNLTSVTLLGIWLICLGSRWIRPALTPQGR
jgi:hypothetical protein